MSESNLSHFRKDYTRHELLEETVSSDPMAQFALWFEEAIATGRPDPNAMTLTTVGTDLQPSSRVVLLKEFKSEGFVFFTNYASRKGQQIAANPKAALLFYWPDLERQIRIEGLIEKIPAADSNAYFAERPRGSQIGAHASAQSQVLAGREELEQKVAELEAHFADQSIPRPESWGGYCLKPERIEFWQGRPSRLHDRLCFRLHGHEWLLERLSP